MTGGLLWEATAPPTPNHNPLSTPLFHPWGPISSHYCQLILRSVLLKVLYEKPSIWNVSLSSLLYLQRCLLFGRKAMTNLDSTLKSRDVTLPTKVHLVTAMVFPVVMYRCWELDHKEGWAQKNWCFRILVLEKTLESSLDCKKIKPVNPKGNQPRIFIGRTDAKAEAPLLWPPDVKSWLIGKNLDAGKDLRTREEGDRMRWLDGIMVSITCIWANSGDSEG